MERSDVYQDLRAFIARELLDGDETGLDGDTRLLETGILDSMSMIDLIAHLERRLGLLIPHREITPDNFVNLQAIVELALRVGGSKAASREHP